MGDRVRRQVRLEERRSVNRMREPPSSRRPSPSQSTTEQTFSPDAGVPYRLWIRGRAESNYWGNDSVFVQFDSAVEGAVASTGSDRRRRSK